MQRTLSQRFSQVQKQKKRARRAPARRRAPRPQRARQARGSFPRTAAVGLQTPGRVMSQSYAPTRVTHRELLTTVYGGTQSKPWGFNLNPRVSSTFPWLAYVAQAYDMFKFESMQFEYVHTAAATLSGSVAMFIEHDPSDDDTVFDFNHCSSMANAVSTSCYQDAKLIWRPNMALDPSHHSFCDSNPGTDALRSAGVFYFISESDAVGSTAAPLLGKIYVRYTVTFFNPETPGTLLAPSARINRKNEDATETTTAANPNGEPGWVWPIPTMAQVRTGLQAANEIRKLLIEGVTTTVDMTETVAACPRIEGPMMLAANFERLDQYVVHDPSIDPVTGAHTDTTTVLPFEDDPESLCVVLRPDCPRDICIIEWSYGQWTPDEVGDSPYALLETSPNMVVSEGMINRSSTTNSNNEFPTADIAYPVNVLCAWNMHITDSKPAFFTPRVRCRTHAGVVNSTGTWVAGMNSQRLQIIPNGFAADSAAYTWQPKYEL